MTVTVTLLAGLVDIYTTLPDSDTISENSSRTKIPLLATVCTISRSEVLEQT